MIKSRDKNKSNARSKKGFIFTLLALLVIAFMVIEISIYFSAYQVRQESEPLKIRTKVVEEFATQLTGENIQNVSYISAYNAVHTLAKDAAIRPVVGTSTENISKVIGGLFWNGTRPDETDTTPLISTGTLESWQSNLSDLADKVGIDLTISTSDFKVHQSDPWTVQINYTFTYALWDDYTKTNISDVYDVSVNVPIYGAEDPLFKNKTRTAYPDSIRNIFSYGGVNTSKIVNISDNTNTRGRGWYYGQLFEGGSPIDSIDPIDYTVDNKKMIVYTTSINFLREYGNMFGAVLYSGDDFRSVGSVVDVPFIASQSLSSPAAPAVLIKSGSDTEDNVANFTIYNIEPMRSFLTCTYYTTNIDAPSFFDRLSEGRPNIRLNLGMGIETSLVGQGSWVTRDFSSIDHMYYNQTSGVKVMGMTGCKNHDMCKDPISPKFLIDTSHISWYGLDELVCTGDNSVRCG